MAKMHIPGLEWIGWALLNSFWQLGLLSLLYLMITARDTRFTAAIRHNIALVFSIAGSVWFASGLLGQYSSAASAPSVADVFPAGPKPVFPTVSPFLFYLVDQLVSFLPYLYLSVLLLRAGNGFRIFRNTHSTISAVSNPAGTEWTGFLESCRRELGIRRPVILRWTAGKGMAFTRGFFRPLVFFPVALLNRLSVDQVEAIFVHELAHIRRNDFVTHLWMNFFRFVFYFNPFARFLYEVVSREREQACDDLVLDRNYSAAVYARALMTLEQFRQSQRSVVLAAAGYRPLQLSDRIRRICGLPATPSTLPPAVRFSVLLLIFSLSAWLIHPAGNTGSENGNAQVKSRVRTAEKSPLSASLLPKTPAGPVIPELTIVLPTAPVPPPPCSVKAFPHREAARPQTTISDDRNVKPVAEDTSGTEETNEDADPVIYSEPQSDPMTAAVYGHAPSFASGKEVRVFSYKSSAVTPVPAVTSSLQPYVPSASFEYLVADSVPAIALQSLQENKPAVLQLLAKWKALQWQQSVSKTLEQKYQQLKQREQKEVKSFPNKEAELKKALQHLKQQMKQRKAEIDQLTTQLGDGPVIYI